ncbi:hypothetical protein ACIP6X_40685 [Streptomyces coeruleorubidus]|uniref:hypothetical protein n=1 Tax=Streptomyces coeruleorubidus TaxID=116188 RepID=UPI0037F8AA4D
MLCTVTGKQRHAGKAREIMDAWSARLRRHTGDNAALQAGWTGSVWARAAEIVRHTRGGGWPAERVRRFEGMLRTAHLPEVAVTDPDFPGSWDLVATDAVIAVAVFLDDRRAFGHALERFRERVPAYFYLGTAPHHSPCPAPASPPRGGDGVLVRAGHLPGRRHPGDLPQSPARRRLARRDRPHRRVGPAPRGRPLRRGPGPAGGRARPARLPRSGRAHTGVAARRPRRGQARAAPGGRPQPPGGPPRRVPPGRAEAGRTHPPRRHRRPVHRLGDPHPRGQPGPLSTGCARGVPRMAYTGVTTTRGGAAR